VTHPWIFNRKRKNIENGRANRDAGMAAFTPSEFLMTAENNWHIFLDFVEGDGLRRRNHGGRGRPPSIKSATSFFEKKQTISVGRKSDLINHGAKHRQKIL